MTTDIRVKGPKQAAADPEGATGRLSHCWNISAWTLSESAPKP